MLGKRPTPVIGRLTGSLFSGNRAGGVMDSATSPRGPLEFKIVSPRSLKNYDLGGVGLGIVAALETSAAAHHEIHTTTKAALWNRNLNRSDPIPVNSTRIGADLSWRRGVGFEESVEMVDSFEDYTFVTCHKPGVKPFTKVYYDGSRQRTGGTTCGSTTDFGRKSSSGSKRPSMFTLSSPARIGDFPVIPDPDFLNSCHLCHKKLHGKDIFMYRGEKAFCSSECRDSQILKDEQKEKCRSEASRTFEVSSSAYEKAHGQILSPGIFAI